LPTQKVVGEELKKHGSELVAAVVYDKDKTTYRSEIDQVLKDKPDIIYLNGYTADVTVVLKDLYKAGYTGAKIAQAYAVVNAQYWIRQAPRTISAARPVSGSSRYSSRQTTSMSSRSQRWAGEPSSRRCHNIDVRTTGDVKGSSRSCKADSAPRIIASATRRLSVATMFDWPRTTPVAR